MIRSRRLLLTPALSALAGMAVAQSTHPVVPAFSSNSTATYSLYLDFGGFNYTGTWGTTGKAPGVVQTFSTDPDRTTFSAADVTAIQQTWAEVAQKYVGFNINVTTVDPAAGQTDAQRQTFYDQKQYFEHSIYGGASSDWYGSAGGVSYVGFAQNANVLSGFHTNFDFAETDYNYPKYTSEAGAHEDGHALQLNHQHDEANGSEYSTNNNASGSGTYAPIMGAGYYSQRGTWRVGSAAKGNANDVAVLETNAALGPLLDDGIGHSSATATSLAIKADGTVDAALAKGFIMPKVSTGYSAGVGVGDEAAYTHDFIKFNAKGGATTFIVTDGTDFIQTGVADPGSTMRSVVRIYTSTGTLLGTATEDASTLIHTFTGNLSAGSYYAQVVSYGAYVSAYEPNSRYFNMGAYFVSGSGFAQAVPEPATLIVLAAGLAGLVRRRRN